MPPERHPCGQRKKKIKPRTIEQIAEAQRAAEESEMIVVLSQPHRRGNRSQLAENPLGRFCLEHKLNRALYDAAEAYIGLRRKWAAVWDSPMPDRLGGLGGSGYDPDMEDIHKWEKLLNEWEREMLREGKFLGRLSVYSLMFDRPEPTVKIYPTLTIRALYALAVMQGRLTTGSKSL